MSGAASPLADPPPIRVEGLRSVFGEKVVHEDLDLEVRKGEILAVVGGSGSGKSVLMNSILGLKKPDGGRIELFGRDIDDPDALAEAERRLGVLFQYGALFSFLTVQENVEAPFLEHTGLPMQLIARLARLKIELAGLPARAGSLKPAELSGGMRKRAGVARAIALDPDILFLDEPTSGLDPIGANEMDRLIAELREALGLTVFMITHDLETLYAICDRIAVMADHKIIAIGSVAELERSDHPWIRDYFFGPRGRAIREKRR